MLILVNRFTYCYETLSQVCVCMCVCVCVHARVHMNIVYVCVCVSVVVYMYVCVCLCVCTGCMCESIPHSQSLLRVQSAFILFSLRIRVTMNMLAPSTTLQQGLGSQRPSHQDEQWIIVNCYSMAHTLYLQNQTQPMTDPSGYHSALG